jgi:hypothetical protein
MFQHPLHRLGVTRGCVVALMEFALADGRAQTPPTNMPSNKPEARAPFGKTTIEPYLEKVATLKTKGDDKRGRSPLPLLEHEL